MTTTIAADAASFVRLPLRCAAGRLVSQSAGWWCYSRYCTMSIRPTAGEVRRLRLLLLLLLLLQQQQLRTVVARMNSTAHRRQQS